VINQLSPCSISISPLIILHPIALLRKLVRSMFFWGWLDHMVSDLINKTSFDFLFAFSACFFNKLADPLCKRYSITVFSALVTKFNISGSFHSLLGSCFNFPLRYFSLSLKISLNQKFFFIPHDYLISLFTTFILLNY